MGRRVSLIAAVFLAGLGLAVLLAGGLLLSTRTGAGWALRAFGPPELSVERIRGRLLGPLVLEGVRLLASSGEMTASEVRIEWRPRRLLRREVHLTRIRIREVEVQQAAAIPREKREPTEAPNLSLPVAVTLDVLSVEGLTVRSPDGEVLRVSEATLKGGLTDRILRVDSLRLGAVRFRGGRLGLVAQGTYEGRTPHPLALSVRWTGELPGGRPVEGDGEVVGDLSRIRIRHRTSRPVSLRLEALLRDVLEAPGWEGRAELSSTRIRALFPEGPEGTVTAVVSGHGTTDSATARVDGSLGLADLERIEVESLLTADRKRVRMDSVTATLSRSGGSVRARGVMELAAGERSGRIAADWTDLRWPLTDGEATVRSPSGTLALEGSLDRFEARLDGVAEAASFPRSRLSLHARGREADGLRLDGELTSEVQDGEWDGERIDAAFALEADSESYELRSLNAALAGTGASVAASGRLQRGEAPRFDLQGRWADLRYPLRGDSAWASSRGHFELGGTAAAFTLGVGGGLSRPGVPAIDWTLDVEGGTAGDTLHADARFSGVAETWPAVQGSAKLFRTAEETRIDTLTLRIPETGAAVDATASLPASSGGSARRVRARASWRDLGWPLSPNPALRSERGTAVVEGADSLVRMRMRAEVSGTGVPAADVSLDATGTLRGVALDSLRVQTLGGRITGDGRAARDSVFRWTLRLAGRGLDPSDYAPGWPGSLDLDLETRGSVGSEGTSGRVTVSRLEGTLRERDLRTVLDARMDRGVVEIDTLTVRSGASRFDAAGAIGPPWDLGWSLEADDLADFHPAAAGRLASRGRIAGPSDSLRIRATATGGDLASGRTYIGRLDLDADVDLRGASSSMVRAEVRSVTAGTLAADSIRVRANGRPADHRMEVKGFWGPDQLAADASGGVTEGSWRGALGRLDFHSERAGRWGLDGPVPLRAGPDSASMGELCWVGPAGRACASGSWSPTGGAAWSAMSRGVPLAFFAPFFPPDLALEGAMALESRGSTRPGETPTGEAVLEVDPGLLRYRLADGSEIERPIERFRVEAVARGGDVEGSVDLRLADVASVEGSLRTSLGGPVAERSLEGRLGLVVEDEGLLGSVVEGVSDTGGRISGRVEVGGTLGRPRFGGRLDAEDGRATITPLGIRITGIGLALRPDVAANRWIYEGGARSGEGNVDISGSLSLAPDSLHWSLDSRVSGRRFEGYRTALGHVLVTPALRVRASPERVDVTGDISLPRARLTARRLEPTVATSADVIVTNGVRPTDEEGGARVPPILSGRVTVVLGEDVGLDALGIRGELEGTLLISAEPGRLPTASGELRILQGSYTAYRQTLQIERGRLLYANSPLDDPSLDLRITRRSQGVLAGMNVTGSAGSPTVMLFSEPALADQEILAYLITGRPLNGLSQGEGRIVESLSRSVGISGGNLVLARLGMMFGLEHARFERGPGGEGASVILGRQLLPRLDVDYAVGLLGAPNVVRLRYQLGRGWYLQSESGRETGADVVYLLDDR